MLLHITLCCYQINLNIKKSRQLEYGNHEITNLMDTKDDMYKDNSKEIEGKRSSWDLHFSSQGCSPGVQRML